MENGTFRCAKEANATSTLSRKGSQEKRYFRETSTTTISSPETCNAVKKSKTLATGRRVRRSERLKKRPQMEKMVKDEKSVEGEDDKEEVEEKIGALKQIVPGGEDLGVDVLFEKTAAYILALQLQIKALNYLTTFVQASEDEQRKLGG